MSFPAAQRQQRTPDVLYEPRALWEVRGIDTDLAGAGPWRIALDKSRWRNGRRHTLILTHLLLDAPSYLLRRNAEGAASATGTRNAQSVLNTVKVQVEAPFRSWFSRKPVIVHTFSQKSVAEPPMDFTGTPYASSLFGLTRWDFRDTCPHPFWIPQKATGRFDMSGYSAPAGLGIDWAVERVFATGFFDEVPIEGAALREPGVGRMSEVRLPILAAHDSVVFPAGANPFPIDAFGVNAVAAGANSMWAHRMFSSQSWRGDETARGVTHKELRGFGFAIDQIAYDEVLQGVAGAEIPGQPLTPLASRLGTRCRMNAGGSGEWWWEPGAPLSLVSPTLGPAQVYEFHEPIKLAHAEALEVSVEIPSVIQADDPRIPNEMIIGVSMLGYAIVEG